MAADWFRIHAVQPGDLVAVSLADGVGIGLAVGDQTLALAHQDPAAVVAQLDREFKPRWVWWDRATADALASASVHIIRCWDVLTVHRLQRGGWRGSIVEVWIDRHGLDPEFAPSMGQMGLLDTLGNEGSDKENPVRPDKFLRPEWSSGGWATSPDRLATWAQLAYEVATAQRIELAAAMVSVAHAESAAELLCAELTYNGLPFDRATAEVIIEKAAGPPPLDDQHEQQLRATRDAAVWAHIPGGRQVDLRNPANVKAMLHQIELDLPDTRAWRLEQHVDHHPLVPALLQWRKAERLSNTYGYRWLDEHVRDGRLRGQWSSSDGAAGRMTATSGLHNLPAELRPAVRADDGYFLVRADLGQIEPRVWAAISGDDALVAAAQGADMYQPVADRLGVDRDTAKVAILGAMYGATTGESANALRGLQRAYPTAMQFLEAAAERGRNNESVTTFGGRPVHMWDAGGANGDLDRARRVAAAKGRFARNAVIQGTAAEFFKIWALVVRARGRALDAEVVLCLHDELLVHVPTANGAAAVALVQDALQEAAFRWSPRPDVKFVTDTKQIRAWSESK